MAQRRKRSKTTRSEQTKSRLSETSEAGNSPQEPHAASTTEQETSRTDRAVSADDAPIKGTEIPEPAGPDAGAPPKQVLFPQLPSLSRIMSVVMLVFGIFAVGVLFYRLMIGFFVPLF